MEPGTWLLVIIQDTAGQPPFTVILWQTVVVQDKQIAVIAHKNAPDSINRFCDHDLSILAMINNPEYLIRFAERPVEPLR